MSTHHLKVAETNLAHLMSQLPEGVEAFPDGVTYNDGIMTDETVLVRSTVDDGVFQVTADDLRFMNALAAARSRVDRAQPDEAA